VQHDRSAVGEEVGLNDFRAHVVYGKVQYKF
jgi:hypothetical protein